MSSAAQSEIVNSAAVRPGRLISRSDISWLIAGRLLLLSLGLVTAAICTFYYTENEARTVHFIFGPLAVAFFISALSSFWLKFHKESQPFAYLQFLFDVLLITGIIYVTGGPISPFLFLYLPLAMAAAALESRRFALLVSFVSALVYSLMIEALLYGAIHAPLGAAVQTPSNGVLLQIIGLSSGLVLVSVGTAYLTRVASSNFVIAEQQKKDIVELNQAQKLMIDGLPDGVITTDASESIISINRAAKELLHISDAAIGRPLAEVLKKLDSNFEVSDKVASVPMVQREIEITNSAGEVAAKMVYHTRQVQKGEGGVMFIFQDVTKLRSIEEQLAIQERMARLLAEKDIRSIGSGNRPVDFIGESPVMQKVFNLIERVAPSDATVLVSGESGTGKELVARAIHRGSSRCNGPFVAVNCGAIPENLIESEMFGHKKGSFTGAEADYIGLFRQADGGTVFLDEIGELPLHMQTKLLRTIQERTVRPIGGTRDIPVSLRIVAATNRNLRKEVESGNFREDLFYRLNVISINLPGLRQRKEDIPLLVNAFLKDLISEEKTPVVSPQAMNILLNYNYPGNVRELENILERAVVLGSEVILPEHLPENVSKYEEVRAAPPQTETTIIVNEEIELPVELDKILEEIERRYLEIALSKSQGAKKKAAEMLGINFRSFRYRLQKFGMTDE